MSCKNCTCADTKENIITMPYEDEQRRDHIQIPKEVKLKSYLNMIGKELLFGKKQRKILSVKVTETHIHIEFEPLKTSNRENNTLSNRGVTSSIFS